MKIAVLLTTFNRKEKTLACLQTLHEQFLPDGTTLEVFLTDDASTDGTAQAVRESYPETNIFSGTGTLYWAGGMRHTWRQAILSKPDFYLLLNDDTTLFTSSIMSLIETAMNVSGSSIIAGTTVDRDTGEITYGGWNLVGRGVWKSHRVFDMDLPLPCDFANANILLVGHVVVQHIGILADHFTHSLADYDYTLNAKKNGLDMIVAPGVLGFCTDDHGNNWKPTSASLKERVQYLRSPKGLAYHEFLRFIRDHFPRSYPSTFAKLWLKTLCPFLWDWFKTKSADPFVAGTN